jgi:hypothetical protein
MRALAKEYRERYGTSVDSRSRKQAFIAVTAASERNRRFLTPVEARQVIPTLWKLEP